MAQAIRAPFWTKSGQDGHKEATKGEQMQSERDLSFRGWYEVGR